MGSVVPTYPSTCSSLSQTFIGLVTSSMPTLIFFRLLRRFVRRCLKHGLPLLSAISTLLRHVRYIISQLQKRCYLQLSTIEKWLMEAMKYLGKPVSAHKSEIMGHLLAIQDPSTEHVDKQLHIAQIGTLADTETTTDRFKSICLAEAVYSCLPSDGNSAVSYHSSQILPYIDYPDLSHDENEEDIATDTPVVSSTHGDPKSNPRVLFPHLDNPRIKPVMPEGIRRYEGRHKIAKESTEMTIQPLTLTYDSFGTPVGWFKCTHPEGGRYFYHAQKNVYTDADLCDCAIHNQIMMDLSTLEQFVSHNGIVLPEVCDLVLDLRYGEHGDIETKYYYLHHPTRAVFFLDSFNGSDLHVWYELRGIVSGNHLRHEIEAQYWYHVILYPHSLKVTDQLAHELLDMVLHFYGDVMSSPTSASPFTLEELRQALTLAKTVKRDTTCWQSVGAASLVSRLMHIFARSRFYNYYGEQHARLERTASVYADCDNGSARTWFIKITSPLLFFIPDNNLKSFQKAYVDAIVHKYDWERIMKTLNHEWKQMVLLAILMMNVNVGLLSAPEVEPSWAPHRSPSQISIYLSIVCSVGSVALGSLLARSHKGSNTNDYTAFLSKANHSVVGLEKLAILYSLPSALVTWSVVAFLIGVFFLCFQRSSIEARIIVGVIAAIIATFSMGTWSSWGTDIGHDLTNAAEIASKQETSTEETFPKSRFNAFGRHWSFPKLLHTRRPRNSIPPAV